MTKPPAVEKTDTDVVVVLNYVDGDQCTADSSKKYSTRVTLICGKGQEQVCVGNGLFSVIYS